ncbi:DMT family transporter [Chitinibacteraceae bacterium HSL-7]
MRTDTQMRGVVLALGAGMLWGLVFVTPQLLPQFSPLALAIGRYLVYGLLALLLAIPFRRRLLALLDAGRIRVLVGQALAGNLVYYVLLAYAVQWAGTALAALIVGMMPLVVSLAGRRDSGSIGLRRLAPPLALVALGMVCINADVLGAASHAPLWQRVVGVLCAFGALASWSGYAVQNARYLQQHREIDPRLWSWLYGLMSGVIALLVAVPLWLQGDRSLWLNVPPEAARWLAFWGGCTALAVLASMVANTWWNHASRMLPLTLTGQLIVFETLSALVYSFVLYQRWPRPLEWLAAVLLLTGVVWAIRLHRPRRAVD